jgi:hypothetical protein
MSGIVTSFQSRVQLVHTQSRWQIIWQDSLLSITYDRASSAATMEVTQQSNWDMASGKMPYIECMRSLCKIGLDIVRHRPGGRGSHHELTRIVDFRGKLNDLKAHAADHLQEASRGRSMRDQLEHWNWYLHRSYVTSELCRPLINQGKHPSELSISLRRTCLESLADTVEAFIGLQNITAFASQSWAAVHRSLSSALLLAILGEPSRNERVHKLLNRLITVMSAINSAVDPSELSAPITRSVAAIFKLMPAEPPLVPLAQVQGSNLGRIPLAFDNTEIDYYSVGRSLTNSSSPFFFGSEEASPYSIMDHILWGDQHVIPP